MGYLSENLEARISAPDIIWDIFIINISSFSKVDIADIKIRGMLNPIALDIWLQQCPYNL